MNELKVYLFLCVFNEAYTFAIKIIISDNINSEEGAYLWIKHI